MERRSGPPAAAGGHYPALDDGLAPAVYETALDLALALHGAPRAPPPQFAGWRRVALEPAARYNACALIPRRSAPSLRARGGEGGLSHTSATAWRHDWYARMRRAWGGKAAA